VLLVIYACSWNLSLLSEFVQCSFALIIALHYDNSQPHSFSTHARSFDNLFLLGQRSFITTTYITRLFLPTATYRCAPVFFLLRPIAAQQFWASPPRLD
jgi:hypothetical protein